MDPKYITDPDESYDSDKEMICNIANELAEINHNLKKIIEVMRAKE